jgi:hypothetical protein
MCDVNHPMSALVDATHIKAQACTVTRAWEDLREMQEHFDSELFV